MKKRKKEMEKRIYIIATLIIISFFFLTISLVKIIYFQNEYYSKKLVSLTEVIIEGETAPRGRIYDRNYNLLVDNASVPIIYYQKPKNISISEEISLIYKILEHLDIDTTKLTTRNLKEFWLANNNIEARNRITKEEYEKLKRRILSTSDIENLKLDRITDKDLEH